MNTDQLISHSRSRFEHAANKRLLKEKYQSKMVFAHAGGLWRAGPELLTTLYICQADPDVVLMDLYENPVRVNPAELLLECKQRWQEEMNAWEVEHTELKKNR
jgi:hypothetical protein